MAFADKNCDGFERLNGVSFLFLKEITYLEYCAVTMIPGNMKKAIRESIFIKQ